ncbi:MAG TPA: amylo-alpha-1,6-glucosidase [Vicinamibacterales bacterium]|nr:amylo-alpha-1,6-glucosidase [Vicinamibacterales bacterium]
MSVANTEWLEVDGLGGFASGTATGLRSRRYHGLLVAALTPPTGRVVLVNGFDAWIEIDGQRRAISSQRYAPDVVHPDGIRRLESFSNVDWPRWTFRLENGTVVDHEIIVRQGAPLTAMAWRLREPRDGARLGVRPLLSGRDYHSLHHENGAFRFDAHVDGQRVSWQPYDGLPAIIAIGNGRYVHAPDWYRNFVYEEERTRGLDCVEDLASPGYFEFDLSRPAVLAFTTAPETMGGDAEDLFDSVCKQERQRRAFASPLHRAADAYLVRRGSGKTIVAGYPWFTDWGRDTFIAIRGLCIATGRLAEAREILLAWSTAVSEGMLPNRFPDSGDTPEFNAVDASLWYVIAIHDFLAAASARSFAVSPVDLASLRAAIDAILEGYASGTRFGIRADEDGLLACGVPGVQLTWMDARIGDWVVTPRIGKPVEVQALWLNALAVAAGWTNKWVALFEKGQASFARRFWNADANMLFDVVDVNHERGTADASFRPNQIFAIGGLPLALLDGERAREVVDAVESQLVTPMGLRSLAPSAPGYAGRYEGNGAERDGRYHQGTVWPWLLGPFVDAWVRVRRSTAAARRDARERFLVPLLQLAEQSGGHVPEIADGDPPHTPRGCPQQAWSVGELLRLESSILSATSRSARKSPARVERSA